ncbi:sulfotransferase 2A1-like isoform X1 [Nycticebus coucang]|uniref:sulfotransferase 2A1-like isoform X1 n=1 Tax=Nycticebus coucang TaxID=9470 RepID=UPI00234D2157|nr:sulfotransferase 2A1-like isoform X1 [Nycticebus coucang]
MQNPWAFSGTVNWQFFSKVHAESPVSAVICLWSSRSLERSLPYGSWFDYVCGWVSMRERENFLMLSYEELKWDTEGTVEKISQFLGKKVEPEELDLIIKNNSFEVMRKNKMSNLSMLNSQYLVHKNPLLRKGITGDWKNYFTVAQAEAFDKVFQEKMADLPRELFPWE